MTVPLLDVEDLVVEFPGRAGPVRVVDGVSLRVQRGEAVGLVGESGSGKSTTALAVLRLLPRGTRLSGAVRLGGEDVLALPAGELSRIRGTKAAMVFQDPGQSLHPQITVGEQIAEVVRVHERLGRREADRRAVEVLERVRIARPELRARQYPRELSGGMQQRVMLAMALSCRPSLLLADEPTTALDPTIQAQILELLRTLRAEMDLGVLFISHDLALVSELCDRVVVLYAGQVVEEGATATVLTRPRHPYTEALLHAAPHAGAAPGELPTIVGAPPQFGELPEGCRFHPRCSYAVEECRAAVPPLEPSGGSTVRCIRADELDLAGEPSDAGPAGGRSNTSPAGVRSATGPAGEAAPAAGPEPGAPANEGSGPASPGDERLVAGVALRREYRSRRVWPVRRRPPPAVVVDGVDLELHAGETVGLVGESGSGKSTTARLLLRLVDVTGGTVEIGGRDVTHATGAELRRARGVVQAVFQDVAGSLDPTMSVAEHLAVPLGLHQGVAREGRRDRATELLEAVGLSAVHLDRYPYELSGGQRQRVVLARALAADPRAIVLDEPVSSLDVSTQSQAVNLLARLQRERGLAYLLIAHDLPLVRHLSHRIAVMYLGRIVESGPAEQVYARPRHPYTHALLQSVPTLGGGGRERRVLLRGEIPGPDRIPSGCRFRTRCPYAFDRCEREAPATLSFADGGTVECHLHDSGPSLAGRSVDELLDDGPGTARSQSPEDRSPQGDGIPWHASPRSTSTS